ncbi:RNA-binding protein [bacterium F11]|nr:RNA-binding protein [bacterium F11]
MSKRLYVGNLPFSTTEDQLNNLFTSKGQVVSATLITDKFSKQSKGFGFVEMSNDSEATAAIESFNNCEMNGRNLTVNEARPREKRSGGEFSRNRSGGSFNKNW